MRVLGNASLIDGDVPMTYAGQAHFGLSGPTDKRCADCASFEPNRQLRLDIGTCKKFYDLTSKKGSEFPESAFACKYFEPKP